MTIYTDNNLIDGMTCLYRITATDSLGVSTSVVIDPANMPGHSITAEGTGGTDITYQVTLVDVGGNVDYEVYIDSEFVGSATNIATPDVRDPVTFTLTPSPGVTTFLVSLWVAPTGGTHTLQQIVEVTLVDAVEDLGLAYFQAEMGNLDSDIYGYLGPGWDAGASFYWYSPSGIRPGDDGFTFEADHISSEGISTVNYGTLGANSTLGTLPDGQEVIVNNISLGKLYFQDEVDPQGPPLPYDAVVRVYHPTTGTLVRTYDTRNESHRIYFYSYSLVEDINASTTTLDINYAVSGPTFAEPSTLTTYYAWTKNGIPVTSPTEKLTRTHAPDTYTASGLVGANTYGMTVYLDAAGTELVGSFEFSDPVVFTASITDTLITQNGDQVTVQARVTTTPENPFYHQLFLDGSSASYNNIELDYSGALFSETVTLTSGTYSFSLEVGRSVSNTYPFTLVDVVETYTFPPFTVT